MGKQRAELKVAKRVVHLVVQMDVKKVALKVRKMVATKALSKA